MNIAELLREQAHGHPDAPAIIDTWHGHPRRTTYAELERAAGQGAALLWRAGLRPGHPVLVCVPMSAELYAALIAMFRLGVVPMFVDPAMGRTHLEQCCAIAPPRAFIGSAKAHLLRAVSPALRRIPRKFVVGMPVPGAVAWSQAERLAPREEVRTCQRDEPALITFTSGSTGQPKAAVRTHGLLLAQYRVLARHFGGSEPAGGLGMTALPIFVLADLAAGDTSLIPPGDLRHPGRIDPQPVIAALDAFSPSRAGGSPAFWERIVAHCREQQRTLPHLRTIYLGGAPVFPHLLDALHEIAPQARIVAVYGSTEAEPIAHIAYGEMQTDDLAAMASGHGLLVGTPVPEIQLRVLQNHWGTPIGPLSAAAFASWCLPPGEPGEIVVSGEHVLPGYLHGQGDEETKFRVAGVMWHRTGDAGYRDAAGRLWLLGRSAARIADDRGTLYPFTVECAVSAVPEVRRAALVASEGRRTLAFERRAHVSPAALAALRRSVAWADIDEFRELRHIPVDRRHNAKVDYPALRRMLARA